MPFVPAPGVLDAFEVPASWTLDARTVSLLLAPTLVGTVIGWFLYGLLVLQMFHYRKRNQGDPLGIRATVWGVFALETILSGVATRVTYALLCESWGNTQALLRFTVADAFIPIISGLVSGSVQAFYAWRIYGLSNHTQPWTFVAVLVLLLMSISSGAALYSGIRTAQHPDISMLDNLKIRPILLLWLSSTFSCDTIIALSMVFILHRMRRLLAVAGSTNSPFEARLKNILIMSLETCLITTASTIIMLAFFLTLPQSRLLPMMGTIVSYLYSNSLLASLNSRPKAMNRSENASTSLLETFVAGSSTGNRTISQASATTPVTVEIALTNGPRPARRASVQTKAG